MVWVTRWVDGSTRLTVPPPVPAAQTAPSPVATAPGALGITIRAFEARLPDPVVGTRTSRFSSGSAAHSPSASPTRAAGVASSDTVSPISREEGLIAPTAALPDAVACARLVVSPARKEATRTSASSPATGASQREARAVARRRAGGGAGAAAPSDRAAGAAGAGGGRGAGGGGGG